MRSYVDHWADRLEIGVAYSSDDEYDQAITVVENACDAATRTLEGSEPAHVRLLRKIHWLHKTPYEFGVMTNDRDIHKWFCQILTRCPNQIPISIRAATTYLLSAGLEVIESF